MPKEHINTEVTTPTSTYDRHQAFLPLLITTFFIWATYRLLFSFPVWFDEIFGKFVFFGLPVWLYVIIAQSRVSLNTLAYKKFYPGIYLGLLFGGVYGFVGTLATFVGKSTFRTLDIFSSPAFWGEFFLAIITGFWESLFFFGWVYVIAQKRFQSWQDLQVIVFTAATFVIFHLPNTFLRIPVQYIPGQLLLLTAFAIGQALLFKYTKNVYALTVSHAIWGMVLLVYGR